MSCAETLEKETTDNELLEKALGMLRMDRKRLETHEFDNLVIARNIATMCVMNRYSIEGLLSRIKQEGVVYYWLHYERTVASRCFDGAESFLRAFEMLESFIDYKEASSDVITVLTRLTSKRLIANEALAAAREIDDPIRKARELDKIIDDLCNVSHASDDADDGDE